MQIPQAQACFLPSPTEIWQVVSIIDLAYDLIPLVDLIKSALWDIYPGELTFYLALRQNWNGMPDNWIV